MTVVTPLRWEEDSRRSSCKSYAIAPNEYAESLRETRTLVRPRFPDHIHIHIHTYIRTKHDEHNAMNDNALPVLLFQP